MASKYARLGKLLRSATSDRMRLTFKEIEAMLGFELPRSARIHAPWWANVGGSHVQADAWMGAGWRTCQVDVPGERVSFERLAYEPAGLVPSRSAELAETASTFNHAAFTVDPAKLSAQAMRTLADYFAEAGGDSSVAFSRALEDAALTRRRQMIERFAVESPAVSGDSTDLIREDRDAR